MILRRVIVHFRKQDWTAIAIDFLIVVVGVFVGLQVNNWNEARQDRKDERFYLARLQEVLVNAGKFSSRLRQQRIDKLDALKSATQALFGEFRRETLSEEECHALGTSHIVSFALPELPALTELQSSGRLSIIQDEEIRAAFIALQRAQYVLGRSMVESDQGAVPLGDQFPGPLAIDAYVVDETGELRLKSVCNVVAMQGDRAFLNILADNADRYDAYVRFNLVPWAAQFEAVRKLVDGAIGSEH
ncbi:MAG: hypothetical protein IPJ97_16505 [Proteobacteria bacterium]|nr:hypothetical protein [Pseudomonadota bacterium]